jgi:hypothetical protein
LEARSKFLGDKHEDTIFSVNKLLDVFREQRKYDEVRILKQKYGLGVHSKYLALIQGSNIEHFLTNCDVGYWDYEFDYWVNSTSYPDSDTDSNADNDSGSDDASESDAEDD